MVTSRFSFNLLLGFDIEFMFSVGFFWKYQSFPATLTTHLNHAYAPVVDNWIVIDNMYAEPNIIARRFAKEDEMILNPELWSIFQEQRNVMEDKDIYPDEFSEKILLGMKKAIKKLVETSAKNDEELVIRDKDGVIKSVPAKDLLPIVQKDNH